MALPVSNTFHAAIMRNSHDAVPAIDQRFRERRHFAPAILPEDHLEDR
ncbi:hypothetical protein [Amycolatopsis alkalitolerans]|nr:hypothetical protein [Amycolatopsis alkalitolerans]